jgi:hypothetical protein
VHPPDRIKKTKLKKEHYTGGQDFQFLLESTEWRCCSTPSTCQAEGIFGLGWPDWACYFRGAPLTTGWRDPAVCHEPCVNVSNLGGDPLSTSQP